MRRTAAVLVLGVVVGAGVVMALAGAGPSAAGPETPVETATDAPSGTTAAPTSTVTVDGEAKTRTTGGAETTTTPAEEPASSVSNTEISVSIERAIDSERQQAGARPLDRTARLDRLAHHHSREMASNGFFSDESPWGDTLDDRMVQENVDCSRVFDNDRGQYVSPQQLIHRYQGETVPPAEEIVEDAMGTWRANDQEQRYLRLEAWSEVGVSTRRAVDGDVRTVYVTVVFC